MIPNEETYTNNETGQAVLVLMTDDHYVHFQSEGHIKHLFKYEFLEQYTVELKA